MLTHVQADTREFNADPTKDSIVESLPNDMKDNNLLKALQGAAQSKELKDFYLVGFWNYCEGDIDDKGAEKITFCSDRKSYYWFNPVDVWQLSDTSAQKIFPDEMQKGLDAYRKVSRWMYASFILAFFLTIAEFLVGFSALFSRWGSFVTTIVSTVCSRSIRNALIQNSNFNVGPIPLLLRGRRHRNRHVRLARRRLRVRPQALQHQGQHGQADASHAVARCRLRPRIRLLLAHLYMLLLRQVGQEEGCCREDTVHV
jgi:hypothetical protein